MAVLQELNHFGRKLQQVKKKERKEGDVF